LEKRMKAARKRMENLGDRLEIVRKEIEGWERREGEWQARVTQRIRVLGGFTGIAILMVIVAYVIENWTASSASFGGSSSSTLDLNERIDMSRQSGNVFDDVTEHGYSTQLDVDVDADVDMELFLKSPLFTKAHKAATTATDGDTSKTLQESTDDIHTYASDHPGGQFDPLRLFDEL